MNKPEIIEELKKAGIEHDPLAKKEILEELATQHGIGVNPKGGEPTTENPPSTPQTAERTYSASEVQAMLQQVMKDKGTTTPIKKDPNRKELRLSRLEGKFVVDFKNRNNDPYVNKVIHAYNKWDPEQRQNIAWIEVIFDDGSSKEVPLLYLASQASPIVCKILEERKTDTSYSVGETTRKIYKDAGGREDTGILVDQVVTQNTSEFVVETPTGEKLTVPQYVINIV